MRCDAMKSGQIRCALLPLNFAQPVMCSVTRPGACDSDVPQLARPWDRRRRTEMMGSDQGEEWEGYGGGGGAPGDDAAHPAWRRQSCARRSGPERGGHGSDPSPPRPPPRPASPPSPPAARPHAAIADDTVLPHFMGTQATSFGCAHAQP